MNSTDYRELTLLMEQIQAYVMAHPEVGWPEYEPVKGSLRGHSYAATEALYHLRGKAMGLTSCHHIVLGQSHWFLRNDAGYIFDVTAKQFLTPEGYPLALLDAYRDARGRGFLTKEPSKRARQIMEAVR